MTLNQINQLKITRRELKDKLTEKFTMLSSEQVIYDKIKQSYDRTKLSFLQLDRKIAMLERKIISPKTFPKTRKANRSSRCTKTLIALIKSLPKDKQAEVIKKYESIK